MSITSENLNKILKDKKISNYRLSKIIDCSDSILSDILNSKANLSENMIDRLFPVLEIPKEELQSWFLADNYTKNIIETAIEAKQNPAKPVKIPQQKIKKRKPFILTNEIDKRIIEKGLSRTKLSGLIEYNQGGLNKMILGKIPMSKKVRLGIAPILDITQDEITSWVLADKYSLQALETAIVYFDYNL